MMSFNPQDGTNNLESVSPFSSLDSDLNSLALSQKLTDEKEKSRKLEERISGYKTVAQQVPKYQKEIKDLQLKNAEQSQIIALLEKKIQERNNKVSAEENKDEGLTELANPVSAHSPANTRSPSFVILSPPGDGGDESTQFVNEKHTTPLRVSSSSLFKSASGCQESEFPNTVQCKQESVQINPENTQGIFTKQDIVYPNSARSPNYIEPTFARSLNYNIEPTFILSSGQTIYTPVDLPRTHNFNPTIYKPVSVGMSNISSPPLKEFPKTLTYPAQIADQTLTSYGIGAKPKEWAPLNFLHQRKPSEQEQAASTEKLNTLFRIPSNPSTFQIGNTINTVVMSRDLNHKSNDLSQSDIKLVGITDQPLLFPSDDHHHLASQAESMAAILKSTHSPSGISEMLLEFSKEVGKLEAQLQEKQAQIQRQQVQIQSYTKNISSDRELFQLREENQSLREENENLFAFIMTHSENQGQSAPLNEFRWLTVTNQTVTNQATCDMSKTAQPESPLIRKAETLEKINTKLFLANKDWHNKWEILRQSNYEKIETLEAKIESLLKENENLARTNEELQKQMAVDKTNQEQSQSKILTLEGETINLRKFVESLKKDVELLTTEKRKLDAEVTTLKMASRQRSKEEAGNKALEGEITLLKQQLTVFAEDFEKERQDRAAAESKAEKMRKEREKLRATSESKVKQLNSQFKNLEDALRSKNRQVADLQVQIEDLKLQLHSSQRKATFAPQPSYNYHNLPASTYGPTTHLFQSTGAETSLTGSAMPMASTSFQQQVNRSLRTGPGPPGPEHLAGAWTCKECTYINYPSRSVCDICGYRNIADGEKLNFETGGQELHSRGDHMLPKLGFRDIEADTQPKM